MIAHDLLIDSLYHLHVDTNVNLNEQIVSTVGQKRSKNKINQKYLWHYRLDHIKEDRINKLKKDRIFGSLHSESYPACVYYFQEKMSKLPFIGHRERVTELLISIHTDVCGPFDMHVSGGYSYFIIFTDDLSMSMYI